MKVVHNTVELHSAIKKEKKMNYSSGEKMQLKIIMLSKISQT